ncbi:MAG: rhodanese-like domain-containing protein [Acutalibacteraceae bacterium]
MANKRGRLWALIAAGVMTMTALTGCEGQTPKAPEDPAWKAVAPYHMGFIAVGTEGRIGAIDVDTGKAQALSSPTTVHLRDVAAHEGTLVAVGDGGTLLVSTDGATFTALESGTTRDLYAVTWWAGRWVAGGEKGTLLYWEGDGVKALDSGVKDTVVGLAGGDERCIGVTDAGQAVESVNLTEWTLMDYNGYYGMQTTFHRIVWNGLVFVATGQDEKDGPVYATTQEGGVWTQRDLSYYNDEPQDVSALRVTGVAFDADQTYLACSGGAIYTLPDCSQCNKMETVGGKDFNAVAYNGGKIALVGKDYDVTVLDTDAVRQYAIKSPAALQAQQNGAVIIDVRQPEEYEPRHVKGAINLPVGSVEQTLPGAVPDKNTQIIFYCAKGVRAQTALEKARTMGYTQVYSLGGVDDWEYEFEGTEVP